MKRRRYDSDEDDDGATETLSREIAVDDTMLIELGVIDYEEPNETATSSTPQLAVDQQEHFSPPANVAEPSATVTNPPSRVVEARIDVSRHVRRRPRLDASPTDGMDALHQLLQEVAECPEKFSQNDILVHYRPAERKTLTASGTSSDAPATWSNRFGVRSGWRWDGVIRGTGAESRFF